MNIPTQRRLLRISGATSRSFLQGLISQDIEKLSPDAAQFATLLSPQGKILFDFFLYDVDESILIDCALPIADALKKKLTLYKLRAKVAIEFDETRTVATSVDKIDAPLAWHDPRHAALGWRAIIADAAPTDGTYHARRIAAGVPEAVADFTADEIFLMDVNYDTLAGVDYKKGCFVGQEVTSRMKRKGEPRKRTAIITFDGPPPAPGSEITAGDTTLGTCLSGVENTALALIRIDRLAKSIERGDIPSCNSNDITVTLPAYLDNA